MWFPVFSKDPLLALLSSSSTLTIFAASKACDRPDRTSILVAISDVSVDCGWLLILGFHTNKSGKTTYLRSVIYWFYRKTHFRKCLFNTFKTKIQHRRSMSLHSILCVGWSVCRSSTAQAPKSLSQPWWFVQRTCRAQRSASACTCVLLYVYMHVYNLVIIDIVRSCPPPLTPNPAPSR